jgi:hypothetical protein
MRISPEQRRLVAWYATQPGLTQAKIADKVGLSVRSVQRILKTVETDDAPLKPSDGPGTATPIGTLLDALDACRADGSPDWPTRVRAATALLSDAPVRPLPPAASPERDVPEGAVLVYPNALDEAPA